MKLRRSLQLFISLLFGFLLAILLVTRPTEKKTIIAKDAIAETTVDDFVLPANFEPPRFAPILKRIFDSRIHLVVTFPLLVNNGNSSLNISKDQTNLRNKRADEYIETLKTNLANQHVLKIHLLYDDDNMTQFIWDRIGDNDKLSLHKSSNPQRTLTIHDFVFETLRNELVMISQADIVLDRGFEFVDRKILQENKVLYALSRHERYKPHCNYNVHNDYCVFYRGSHDAYIFVPEGHLAPKAKRMLDHYTFNLGTDNRIIRTYRDAIGYRVLNPCHVIFIIHNHCSNLRGTDIERKRIDGVDEVHIPSSNQLV